jgi:hypothetical protein
MNQNTLTILREHKHKIAVRRAIKRTKQQTTTESEIEMDITKMTTEEREIYELKELMGESKTTKK